MHHCEHEDVDIGRPELPVCPVHGQTERAFHGQQAEDDAGDEVPVEVEFGEKPLDSPQTGISFRRGVKTGGQETEAHCFNLSQSHNKERHELDMGEVDVFSQKSAQRVG